MLFMLDIQSMTARLVLLENITVIYTAMISTVLGVNCFYTYKSSFILKWYLDRKYKCTKRKKAVGKFNRGVLVVFSLKYATTWKLTLEKYRLPSVSVWGLIVAPGHFTTDSETLLWTTFFRGRLRCIWGNTTFCPETMFISPLYKLPLLKVYITVKKCRTFNFDIFNFISFWQKIRTLCWNSGSRDGLVISPLVSGSSGPGSNPGWGPVSLSRSN